MAFCEFQYVKYELLFSMEKFEVRLMDELRRYHYHQIICLTMHISTKRSYIQGV